MTDTIRELLAKVGGNAREILRLFKEGRFPEHEMFEDGVTELCSWTLQLEQHVHNLLEQTKKPEPPEPTVRCTECGGTNVQVVVWQNPNTGEVGEDFGSWNNTDTKFCIDCDDHVRLRLIEGAEPEPKATEDLCEECEKVPATSSGRHGNVCEACLELRIDLENEAG